MGRETGGHVRGANQNRLRRGGADLDEVTRAPYLRECVAYYGKRHGEEEEAADDD